MTRDEVYQHAKELGFTKEETVLMEDAMRIGYEIGRKFEREACARICESLSCEWEHQPNILQAEQATMRECAAAIRNRA